MPKFTRNGKPVKIRVTRKKPNIKVKRKPIKPRLRGPKGKFA